MEYKHYKTGKKKHTANTVGTAVFVVLTIALLAAILVLSPIGKYLNDHVISPVLSYIRSDSKDDKIISALKQQEQPTPEPTIQTVEHDKELCILTISEVPFYILQMGAFNDIESAEKRADEIRCLGAGGSIRKEGTVFRVFAAAYLDEESLTKVQSQVRSDGFEATPYITESYSIKLTLEGSEKEIETVKDAAEQIDHIPTELSMFSLKFDKKEITDRELSDELNKLMITCNKTTEQLNLIQSTGITPIKDLLQKYQEYISTFLRLHDTIQTEEIGGVLNQLQLNCIIDYISFFEQK